MPKPKNHPYLTPRNVAIGENLARLRTLGGLSQEEVAARMRARGADWTGSTVWALEKGRQSLRVAEVSDLAAILNVSPAALALADPHADLAAEVILVWREALHAESRLWDAVIDYDHTVSNGRRVLDKARASEGWAELDETHRDRAQEAVSKSVTQIVGEIRAQEDTITADIDQILGSVREEEGV